MFLLFLEISTETGIAKEDILDTLRLMDMIIQNPSGKYVIRLNTEGATKILENFLSKGFPRAKMKLLKWSPSPFQKVILEGHNQEPLDYNDNLDQNVAIESALEIANRIKNRRLF